MQGFPPSDTKTDVMVRGIPRLIDSKTTACLDIMAGLFPEYQVMNDESYYIGSSHTLESISVFDGEILNGDKILIMRDMGLGDVLLSLPAVRQLKKRFPWAEIVYATLPRYLDLIAGQDFIDRAVSLHDLDLSGNDYKLIVNYIRCLEIYSIERNRGPRVDSFAKMLGMEIPGGERVVAPILSVANKAKASWLLREVDGPIVTYVLQAVAWNRTYPPDRVPELAEHLRALLPRHTIVILDVQARLYADLPGVLDLGTLTDTAMDAAAVCAVSDLVISSDTGLAHMAAALGVPTLVLLSSMPFDWRYAHYGPHVQAIHKIGAAPCVPCWDWQRELGKLQYCNRTKDNVCMEAIKPIEIATRAHRMIRGAM